MIDSLTEVAVSKSVLLMFMIASLVSAGFAVILSLYVGGGQMFIISIPGFVMGAFFAAKYATYDRSRKKEEEHKRSRNRRRH